MNGLKVKASAPGDRIYTEMVSGEKVFYADEPLNIGGSDLAPSPMEYFLASLASCTTITIQMYAKRKGWDIGHVYVSVESDFSDPQNKKINKTISFENELSEEQKNRLFVIAEKCPVSRLMSENLLITAAQG